MHDVASGIAPQPGHAASTTSRVPTTTVRTGLSVGGDADVKLGAIGRCVASIAKRLRYLAHNFGKPGGG